MIPDDVIDDAERLTRLARNAVDENEAAAHRERRGELLDEHGYVARIRSDGGGETLVLHPGDWLEDGEVVIERVDVEAGVEVELSGTGDADEWAAVDEHNRAAAAAVAAEHGEVHGATARALAAFAGNHYAKRVENLSAAERREFVEEYFPRNAWPSEGQRAVVEESVELTRELAGE